MLGQRDEALTAIMAARAAGADWLHALQLQAAIEDSVGDKAGGARTRTELLERFPQAVGPRNLLALYHLEMGDLAAAEACAAALPETPQGVNLRLSLEFRIAVQREDLSEVERVLNRIMEVCENCPPLPGLHAVIMELPTELREDLTGRLIARWPAMRASLHPGRAELDPSRPEGSVGERAMVLALTGRRQEATALLAAHGQGGPALADIRRLVAALPPEESLRRAVIADEGSDVTVSPQGVTGTTVLVFTGLADKTMVPIEYVDRFCAAAGHTAIYLRDSGRTVYVGGIPCLAGDLDGTIAALQGLLQDSQTERLLCLGSSAGGFGAIRYGLRLGAERILCASSPTTGDAEFLDTFGERRARLLTKRMLGRFPARDLDFREHLLAVGHRCRLDLWYGADHLQDTAHARHLEGYPGVRLHPVEGLDRHDSFASLVVLGALQEFLA